MKMPTVKCKKPKQNTDMLYLSCTK